MKRSKGLAYGVGAREEIEGVGVGNRPGEHGSGEGGGEQGGDEERDVEQPPLGPRPGDRAGEDQMSPVGLRSPVVATGPAGERLGELGRGGRVGRIYKRINHFPVRQERGAPRHQELGQRHARS